jgi:hypothetical protein
VGVFKQSITQKRVGEKGRKKGSSLKVEKKMEKKKK